MSEAEGGRTPLNALVLAAGQGTRMRSALPKVLHEAAGRSLIAHVLGAIEPLAPERTAVVIGHGASAVKAALPHVDVEFVMQERQLGTGHALMCAAALLEPLDGPLLVLAGDGPLITAGTLQKLVASRLHGPGMSVLTCVVEDPRGLGRIVRDGRGEVVGIVEEKDADERQKAIQEINTGIMAFDADAFGFGRELQADNAAGEYYITDLVKLYLAAGRKVEAVVLEDPVESLAVNDRVQLALVASVIYERVRREHMLAGVTMLAPETTFVEPAVGIGRDVVLEPGVVIRGASRVGEGARIGAYAVLEDCSVPDGAVIAPHTAAVGRDF